MKKLKFLLTFFGSHTNMIISRKFKPPPPPAVVVLKKNRLIRMLNDNNCTGTIPPKNLAVLIKNRNIPNKKTTP